MIAGMTTDARINLPDFTEPYYTVLYSHSQEGSKI